MITRARGARRARSCSEAAAVQPPSSPPGPAALKRSRTVLLPAAKAKRPRLEPFPAIIDLDLDMDLELDAAMVGAGAGGEDALGLAALFAMPPPPAASPPPPRTAPAPHALQQPTLPQLLAASVCQISAMECRVKPPLQTCSNAPK
eukprot:gnl/Hemi2/18191_TR6021_c0_g1_i1.p2 gnl/Hemi2/18191_TR6021_c0_g1~~gnl/Hemi2/18191_TR6021_c0_g1_i1.p2  ORF type:complete len:146 (-),score=32.48 gnl/Hemi2/18191_TR6021_c0_g1_i1:65-502(-)